MGYEQDFVIHGQDLRNAIGCDFEERHRIDDDKVKIRRGPIKRFALTSYPFLRAAEERSGREVSQQFTVICDWYAELSEDEWHLLPSNWGGSIDEDNVTVAYRCHYPSTKPFIDEKGRLAFKAPLSDYYDNYTVLSKGDNIEKPQK